MSIVAARAYQARLNGDAHDGDHQELRNWDYGDSCVDAVLVVAVDVGFLDSGHG